MASGALHVQLRLHFRRGWGGVLHGNKPTGTRTFHSVSKTSFFVNALLSPLFQSTPSWVRLMTRSNGPNNADPTRAESTALIWGGGGGGGRYKLQYVASVGSG